MNSKRIILGLIVLVLIGGITTALFRLAGGITGEVPEGQNRIIQPLVSALPGCHLAAEGFVFAELG